MYVSRLPFHVIPGKTNEVETQLATLRQWVTEAGGKNCRILRTHFASDGAPDVVLEQEADDLATLEKQISAVTAKPEFQQWSQTMSTYLTRAPKREAFISV